MTPCWVAATTTASTAIRAGTGLPEEAEAEHLGYRVIGTDHDLSRLAKECPHALVAVGHITSMSVIRADDGRY